MDDRMMRFRIGVMVLASLIITVILALLFGPQKSVLEMLQFDRGYTIKIRFSQAPGVRKETPVLKSGIVIGRVTEIELIERGRRAMVSARIEPDQKIFDDEVCRLNRTLLGDSELEFIRVPDREEGKVIDPKVILDGVVSPDPIQVVGNLEGNLSEAIGSVADTSKKLGDFIQKAGLLLGTDEEVVDKRERLHNIVDKTYETADAIGQLATNANELLGDPEVRAELRDAIRQVPKLMQETRDAVARMNQTMDLVDSNLRNIQGFTEALSENGETMLDRLDQGAYKLDRVMGELLIFSQNLNDSQGTLGQLVSNPELYHKLNRAATNMEDLTRQLQPVVRDARVFSDKIARHPELLGVRGAIQRNPGTKGVPRFSFSE